MEVHLGSLIKSRAKALRIGPTELGMRIETSKQNVYGIFKRRSIDTELLFKISLALEYDFFQELSQSVQKAPFAANLANPSKEEPKSSSNQIEAVIRENVYLRRLNGLLEEKLGQMKLPSSQLGGQR